MKFLVFFMAILISVNCLANEVKRNEKLTIDLKDIPFDRYQYLFLLFHNSTQEIDKKIYDDFRKICLDHKKIICVLADLKDSSHIVSKENFFEISLPNNPYNLKLPFLIVTDKDKKVLYYLDSRQGFSDYLKFIFSFYLGEINSEKFEKEIENLEFKHEMTHISPKLNLIIMLYKKGEKQKSVELLRDISTTVKTVKAKIVLSQIYIRIEYPEGALNLLENINSEDALLYRGISYYLLKDYKNAIENLLVLYDNPFYKDKVKEYLIKSYEALGDYEKIKNIR